MTKLDLALTTMETEYKEKLRCLSEENELLRHDTDKVVDLQMELDQVSHFLHFTLLFPYYSRGEFLIAVIIGVM